MSSHFTNVITFNCEQNRLLEILSAIQYDDNGKLLFRGIYYKADFTYWKDHQYIVEDCKGFRTKEYQIKKKLMYYFHHIKIRES